MPRGIIASRHGQDGLRRRHVARARPGLLRRGLRASRPAQGRGRHGGDPPDGRTPRRPKPGRPDRGGRRPPERVFLQRGARVVCPHRHDRESHGSRGRRGVRQGARGHAADVSAPRGARESDPRTGPRLRLRLSVVVGGAAGSRLPEPREDRKSTRLNSSHVSISYAVFCLKKKKKKKKKKKTKENQKYNKKNTTHA